MLHDIRMPETKAAAMAAFDLFVETFEAKYPKAPGCLAKDREKLLAFYDFPAEHWRHIRTTNPIESTFASGAAADGTDQGLRQPATVAEDGAQVGPVGRAPLAEA